MVEYKILTQSNLGDKKVITAEFTSGDKSYEQRVELEPFEFLDTNDEMELVESEAMIATHLERMAEEWESSNNTK
jgi:uncharacterized Zn finger protein